MYNAAMEFASPSSPDSPGPPAGTLLTAADVARLPTTLATTVVDYELHDGKLVVTFPADADHGRAQARLIAALSSQIEDRKLGRVLSRVAVVLRQSPDHLLTPDASFLTAAQLPPNVTPEDYLLTVPALVVEIRGWNDTPLSMEARVCDYLAAGALLVWVVDPESRTVIAHRAAQPPLAFTASDMLTAEGVIPDFTVPVVELLTET